MDPPGAVPRPGTPVRKGAWRSLSPSPDRPAPPAPWP